MANEIYKFNGKNFDKIEDDKWFITIDFPWASWIKESESVRNLWWVQWVSSSATFIRWRLVTLKWKISANTPAEVLTYIKDIKRLFSINWVPSWEWTKLLEITDENWTVWSANARIKNLPEFKKISDYESEYIATFFLSDAVYKSSIYNQENWTEWIIWNTFPTVFPTTFNKKQLSSFLDTSTSLATPLKITINVIWKVDSFIKILNWNNWEFYQTNTECVEWDVIIIDAESRTITKNGDSILWDKEEWSSWLFLSEPSDFIAYDSDLDTDFIIKFEWKDLLL